ncbi:BREX-1 system adenine-specific DNA-methyltransferase PglX [Microbacterium sp. SD291]|uniref:BREX-1 system adenine-specific DNA-methyltransferase PglX n=1 Tax=Microbacterium sp. SD291 TaxID=2782007 RepID=UPI001A97A2F5|nr:BREX-1 system adenine-specific DNA-methyltransferase PglX [Microbacterium sp. SD291]MBO0981601.1 BREX-1 system adenine-specific DNA-methyltransferase PglX [Microbacterium sp. SD291]
MDTKALESFAKAARREMIAAVSAQASAVLAPGSVARTERAETVRRLETEIAEHGHEHVIDKVAYTWFNRLIALRFMDASGYTGAGIVSPAQAQVHGQPEILADAKRGDIDADVVTSSATRGAILGLLDGTRRSTDAEGEAYALLLTEYCRYWHKSMPFMFEREGDYTELLVPAGLLADGGIVARARNVLTEEVCDDVEVIGWLYQFYISERKDEVFAGFKKNKKAGADEIPAATQLFTPHWIVRYLVENSVGRLWMLNRPASRLADRMDYYIAPVDEESDFLKLSGPEELTVIDPACGSGHMLTYAFDLLYAIYEEEGYAPSEIPSLILTHNIHGTEIDPRAGALAAFALTMKARANDRRFLARGIKPSICVIEPISFSADEIQILTADVVHGSPDHVFWNQFEHADTFGSLIQPDSGPLRVVADSLEHFAEADSLLFADAVGRAWKLVRQVEVLSARYAVVVANPPYMGGKQMNALLSQFMKDEYPNSKSDLFAAFIERCTKLAGSRGAVAMITMQSWMFLSSYERLRAALLTNQRFASMLHLGARAFDAIGGDVVSATAFVLENVPPDARGIARTRAGVFIRLVDGTSEAEKVSALSVALEARTKDAGLHLASDSDFEAIPGSPIVYWLSEKMRAVFTHPAIASRYQAKAGPGTRDDQIFLRLHWEVERRKIGESKKWVLTDKAGEFRKWYAGCSYVMDWGNDGYRIRNHTNPDGSLKSRPQNTQFMFREGVAWGKVGSGETSFRWRPQGFGFNDAAPTIFGRDPFRLLGPLNSATATLVLSATGSTLNVQTGMIADLPFGDVESPDASQLASQLVSGSKLDWDSQEISWDFARNPLVALA